VKPPSDRAADEEEEAEREGGFDRTA